MVGSVTGNDNTVGGGGVYPVADLKDLDGLKAGARKPIAMMDGYAFNGAKGYKDSKLALMMLSNMLHDKYHRQTGIVFRYSVYLLYWYRSTNTEHLLLQLHLPSVYLIYW
jgi:hypothetical protein